MPSQRSYACNRCLRKFGDKNKLREHKQQHGREERGRARQEPNINQPDICPYCEFRYAGNTGVELHLQRNGRCGALHEEWKQGLAMASSAAPSVVSLGSDSTDSDAFDRSDVPPPTAPPSEGSRSSSAKHSDAEPMETDIPVTPPNPSPEPTPEEEEDYTLVEAVDSGGNRVYVEYHPKRNAGRAIRRTTPEDLPESRRKYPDIGALSDPESFEVAQLLMESGVSGRFRNRYLTLKRIKNRMPWCNNRALLIDVDKLPHGPPWQIKSWTLDGNRGNEVVEFWKRDSLEGVKQILMDATLGREMRWRPVKHYTTRTKKQRRRDEIWTADWMWDMQTNIKDEYGTIIPCIVSSDETRLTNYAGDKKAHPVYLTIGNIPKRLRRRVSKRATILIGYLPVPKLDCESNVETRRQMKRDLFHRCMEEILQPLVDACARGGELAPCADGFVRRIHPILASYVADFPEQCKIACTKQTHCPLCTVHPKCKGDLSESPLRTARNVLKTMKNKKGKGARRFQRQGLLPITPFWESHPHIELGTLMTPDLLHQVHKGVMKDHLIKWVTTILGKPLLDERYVSMPDCQGMRHFKNGISSVSQWTGKELKEMIKILLPAMEDANPRVVRAARSLMDFMYLSHLSSMTDDDLHALEDALHTFHDHKEVFEALGTVATDEGFHGIPKIHMISHYAHLIRRLGTPDGYNTETSERLHIDFAKLGYRASNKVNATKQMAMYIQRLEAIAMHAAYLSETSSSVPRSAAGPLAQEQVEILYEDDYEGEEYEEDWEDEEDWDEDDEDEDDWDNWFYDGQESKNRTGVDAKPSSAAPEREWEVRTAYYEDEHGEPQGTRELYYPNPCHVVAKTPTIKAVPAAEIAERYGATRFVPAVQQFLRTSDPPCHIPVTEHHRFNLWSRARLFHSPPPYNAAEGSWIDVVRTQPQLTDEHGRITRRARFDTVLIKTRDKEAGIHRFSAARVRAIFQLPSTLDRNSAGPLAYVELFDKWSLHPVEPSGLFRVGPKTTSSGIRTCAVISLSALRMVCHLAPQYSSRDIEYWLDAHSDVLSIFPKFYLNIFSNYYMYELFRHWEQDGMWRSDTPWHVPPAQIDDQDGHQYEEVPDQDSSEEEGGYGDNEGSDEGDEMDIDEDEEPEVNAPGVIGGPPRRGRGGGSRTRGIGGGGRNRRGGQGRGQNLAEPAPPQSTRGHGRGRASGATAPAPPSQPVRVGSDGYSGPIQRARRPRRAGQR